MGYSDEEEKRDWHQAKDRCKELGTELVSVHNAREAAKLTTMLVSLPDDNQDDSSSKLWIGAYESYEGIWWWSDETRYNFVNWSPGEPDDEDISTVRHRKLLSKIVNEVVEFIYF